MTLAVKEVKLGSKLAYLHPGKDSSVAFVIGHGASGDANSGNLPQIAEQIASLGISVVRYNAGGPLKSRIAALEAVMDCKEEGLKDVERWVLAGHSMGGRSACAVALKRQDSVAGLVLFSYPLHPPGKKEELRDADLTALTCPVMIVRGTKDTFSTEPTFSQVMKRMASKTVRIENVEGGDHSLGTKQKAGQERFEVFMTAVKEFVNTNLGQKAGKSQKATEGKKEVAEAEKAKQSGEKRGRESKSKARQTQKKQKQKA